MIRRKKTSFKSKPAIHSREEAKQPIKKRKLSIFERLSRRNVCYRVLRDPLIWMGDNEIKGYEYRILVHQSFNKGKSNQFRKSKDFDNCLEYKLTDKERLQFKTMRSNKFFIEKKINREFDLPERPFDLHVSYQNQLEKEKAEKEKEKAEKEKEKAEEEKEKCYFDAEPNVKDNLPF